MRTSHETYLHACQPNYYSSLHEMIYFVKYNNSIPFNKVKSHQVIKSFINCCINLIPLHVDLMPILVDRIPSTTPGAEPPRDAKDSGSARSHSTHLETSSSNRP